MGQRPPKDRPLGTAEHPSADTCTSRENQQSRRITAEYPHSLKWDGKHRLFRWLPQILGRSSISRSSTEGAKLILLICNRALGIPSSQTEALVLMGCQGTRKSSLLRTLAPADFSDTYHSPSSKSGQMVLGSCLLLEIPDIDLLTRDEIKTLEKAIPATSDIYRNCFAIRATAHPRRAIYVGTTSWGCADSYRLVTIFVDQIIDIEWLEANRDQIFAEAMCYRVNTSRNAKSVSP